MDNIITVYIIPTQHLTLKILSKYIMAMYQKLHFYPLFLKDKNKINSLLSEIFTKVIYSFISKRSLNSIIINKNHNGKPFIKNNFNFFYNISHTKQYIIFACGNYELGCDIELVQHLEDSVLNHFFTQKEKSLFKHKINKNFFATTIWTRKEAYFKFKGIGINDEITNIETVLSVNENYHFISYILNNHIISLCSKLESKIVFKYVDTLNFLNILIQGGNYKNEKNKFDMCSLCGCFSDITIPKVESLHR